MILRAAFALGLVWLLAPHESDLGLPGGAANACDAGIICSTGTTMQRERIFQRLSALRGEIQQHVHAQNGKTVGDEPGKGLQKASLTPSLLLILRQMTANVEG